MKLSAPVTRRDLIALALLVVVARLALHLWDDHRMLHEMVGWVNEQDAKQHGRVAPPTPEVTP